MNIPSITSNEETPENRYNALVDQFVLEKGWSKRKARRYLDAYAKRENERIIKEGKARQARMKAAGELIDTSEESEKIEKEFQAELKAAGIELENPTYKAPTTDF